MKSKMENMVDEAKAINNKTNERLNDLENTKTLLLGEAKKLNHKLQEEVTN